MNLYDVPGYLPTTPLFHSGEFADVVLECQGKEFKAHRLIVAAKSPVLAAMLSRQFKEAIECRVVFKETRPHILEQMLRFIYTGHIQLITKDIDGIDLLMLADAYNIPGLKHIVQQDLMTIITEDNLLDLIRLCELVVGCDVLFNGCKAFAKRSLSKDDMQILMSMCPELAYSMIAKKYRKSST